MDKKDKEYEYYAFISYKREDEKWAKWLQKKLESYGFPVSLRKENPSLPTKIRPVFRDQSDLSGGFLKNAIEKGLKESKYLIIICSPRSAQSPWVSREVQYFINNGKEEYIIPFIIGGIPNASNPEEECFPEGLRQLLGEKEILGININEMGQDAAAVKVVARMFGLPFDSLWRRYERAKRKRNVLWFTCAICFIVASWIVSARMTYLGNLAEREATRAIGAEKIASQQRDSIRKAYSSLKVAMDSISHQNKIISQQRNDLNEANVFLVETNHKLIEERNKVLIANKTIVKKQTSLTAGNIHNLIDNGDILLAERLLLTQIQDYSDTFDGEISSELEIELRRINHISQNGPHKIMNMGHPHVSEALVFPNFTFDESGDYLAYVEDNEIVLYSVADGRCVFSLRLPETLSNVVFNEMDNNRIIVYGSTNMGYIIDIRKGELIKKLECGNQKDSITNLFSNISVSSQDGKIAISYGDRLTVWDWNGTQLFSKDFNYPIQDVIFVPNTDRIALACGNEVMLLEIASDSIVQKLSHPKLVFSSSISPDGSLIGTFSIDSIARVWNVNTGILLKSFPNSSWVSRGYFNYRGDKLVTSAGNEISIWDLTNDKKKTLSGKGYLGKSNNSVIAIFPGKELKICNPFTGSIIQQIPFDKDIRAADINLEKGLIALASNNGRPSLWSLAKYNTYKVFGHSDYSNSPFGGKYMIRDMHWNAGGNRFVTVGDDNLVKLWDYPSFREIATYIGHEGEMHTARFDKDERRLLTASYDSTARIWDIETSQELLKLKHPGSVKFAEFIKNDSLVMTSCKESIYVWDAGSGMLVHKLTPEMGKTESNKQNLSVQKKHADYDDEVVDAFFIKSNNEIIASYRNGFLRLFNLDNPYLYEEEKVSNCRIHMSHSPYIRNFITYTDEGIIRYHDLDRRESRILFDRNIGIGCYPVFLDNGRYIAVGFHDGVVRIIDVDSGSLINEIDCNHGYINGLEISKNGLLMIANCGDDSFVVIDIPSKKRIMVYGGENIYLTPKFDFAGNNIIAPLSDGWINSYEWPTVDLLINQMKAKLGNRYYLSPTEMLKSNLMYNY